MKNKNSWHCVLCGKLMRRPRYIKEFSASVLCLRHRVMMKRDVKKRTRRARRKYY